LAGLLQQVVQEATEQFQQAARLPDGVRFDFDPQWEDTASFAEPSHAENTVTPNTATPNTEPPPAEPPLGAASRSWVLKTARRTVVSLEHGRFQAREIVRHQTTSAGEHVVQHSQHLAELVPRGGRYGFDLIAYVGLETYLHGRSLQDVQQSLAERQPAVQIPLSSLWDQQQRFLFGPARASA